MACSPVLALAIYMWGRKIIVQRASQVAVAEEDLEMISTL
jgi:hypothetical protein